MVQRTLVCWLATGEGGNGSDGVGGTGAGVMLPGMSWPLQRMAGGKSVAAATHALRVLRACHPAQGPRQRLERSQDVVWHALSTRRACPKRPPSTFCLAADRRRRIVSALRIISSSFASPSLALRTPFDHSGRATRR